MGTVTPSCERIQFAAFFEEIDLVYYELKGVGEAYEVALKEVLEEVLEEVFASVEKQIVLCVQPDSGRFE